ncbi:MAG: Flp family type IVb pilin [Deltaproteobacteria bacterium]|nr:Flp family type IVb pilin [Deltaproteobacteria bacterium]
MKVKSKKGANALEYALVAVVVLMVVWAGFDAFGGQLGQFLQGVGDEIIQVGQDLDINAPR